MSTPENKHITSCVSCSESVNGKFCSRCGEKVLKPEDKSVSHFFGEFFHVLTHADSKFLRSLKFLFTRPGFLASEFIVGRRKLYTPLISLFFIANVIYLLIPTTDALNSHYNVQLKGQPYSSLIQTTATNKMHDRNWTEEQIEEHYNHTSEKVSKILLVLIIFLFSVPVMLLFHNKKLYFADHLAFATEFLNFLIFGIFLILPLLLYLFFHVLWWFFDIAIKFNVNFSGLIMALVLVLIQLSISAHRVYKQRWYITIPKALLLTFSFVLCVLVYRFILFQVVIGLL